MSTIKLRFILLGILAAGLGTVTGTVLWLKFAPHSGLHRSSEGSLDGLKAYGSVPEFSLIERTGKKISLKELRGGIWIADFIYTSCTDTCPLQTAEMAKLQNELLNEPGLKLVSFSVDPEKDTPPVLTRYANQFNADRERWLFLTGEKKQVTELVQNGFHLSATSASNEPDLILHSPRLVLVDRQGEIRGYYDSRDQAALRRLRTDLRRLTHQ
jgi:protein SCO1/2